jgi:hypothetical protein
VSELSFLVELLLNHKLPKATKDAIAARIKEVECRTSSYSPRSVSSSPLSSLPAPSLPAHIANQPASTQAAMMRHGDIAALPPPAPEAPPPVEVIAHTPTAPRASRSP